MSVASEKSAFFNNLLKSKRSDTSPPRGEAGSGELSRIKRSPSATPLPLGERNERLR
jgi:hypothetical protein